MTNPYQKNAGTSPERGARPLRWVLYALLALYCAATALHLFRNADKFQSDFRIYITAARAYGQGLSPYRLDTLKQLSGGAIRTAYHYPPPAIYVFRPFAAMDYPAASRLWLALKLAALAGLIAVWRNGILERRTGPFFYLLCLLGFNAAIFTDLVAGNITIFEQLALWTGLALLLRGRETPFLALVVLVSLFKLTTILFLGLPLLLRGGAAWRRCAAAAGAFAAILGATSLLPHGMEFWRQAGTGLPAGRGILAPSTLAFFQDCCSLLGQALGIAMPGQAAWWVYGTAAAAVLVLSGRAVAGLRRGAADRERDLFIVMLACLAYALILPRFKDYNYVLLLAPTAFIAARWGGRGANRPLWPWLFLIYPANGMFRLPVLSMVFPLLLAYAPWVMALAVWILYLVHLRTRMTAR